MFATPTQFKDPVPLSDNLHSSCLRIFAFTHLLFHHSESRWLDCAISVDWFNLQRTYAAVRSGSSAVLQLPVRPDVAVTAAVSGLPVTRGAAGRARLFARSHPRRPGRPSSCQARVSRRTRAAGCRAVLTRRPSKHPRSPRLGTAAAPARLQRQLRAFEVAPAPAPARLRSWLMVPS